MQTGDIILGPAGSGKTAACLQQPVSPQGPLLLLVPSDLAASAIEERLAAGERPPASTPRVMTFEDLATWIITRAGRPLRRLLTDSLKALLLRSVVEGLQISYLQKASDSAGFYRALGSFISELKAARVSPAQFEQATAARRPHLAARQPLADKDREVARIFAAFQQLLDRQGWAEKTDLIAEAALLLKDAPSLIAQDYGAVCLDGFWQFSGVELSLLDAICQAVEKVQLTLPAEPGREVFALTHRTLQRLEFALAGYQLKISTLFAPHDSPASLAHLERSLFSPISDKARAEIADGALVFLEAPGPEGEVEMVAREIRKLTSGEDPIPLNKILVIFRDPAPYSNHLQRYFREYEIPFSLSSSTPLPQIPLARALEHLLRVITDGWQRKDVLALLKSGYLPIDPEKANWVEREARRKGIFRGREQWLSHFILSNGEQAAHLSALVPRSSFFSSQAGEAESQKNHALALVAQVEETLGEYPTPAAFRASLLSWMNDPEVQQQIAPQRPAITPLDPETLSLDAAALVRIDQLLRDLEQSLGPDSTGLTLHHLADSLRMAIASATVQVGPVGKGVRCLSAEEASHFTGQVAFILGLNDKVFPQPPRHEPFYADWERQDARQLGSLKLQTASDQEEKERLLFYYALTRPKKSLYLSRSHSDSEGKELFESFFLSDLKRLFTPEAVQAQTRRRDVSQVAVDEPFTESERLNLSLLRAVEPGELNAHWAGRGGTKVGPSETPPPELTEILKVANWQPQTILETGQFDLPTIFSASGLETYAACPFRYFAEHILHLRPPEEDIGPRERGVLLHQILARLLLEEKAWRQRDKPSLIAQARSILDQAVSASGLWRRDERGYRLGLLREALLPLLDGFVDEELRLRSRLPDFHPAHFELSFGYERPTLSSPAQQIKGEAEDHLDASLFARWNDPASLSRPLLMGDAISVRGRIDRVDLGQQKGDCLIFDYKSGKTQFNLDQMRRGESLQLPLYLLAASDLWGFRPLAGLIFSSEGLSSGIISHEILPTLGFQRPAPKKRLLFADLDEVRQQVVPIVEGLVSRIRSGFFQPSPGEPCRFCRFTSLCRQEQTQIG